MISESFQKQFKSTWLTTSFTMILFLAVTYFLIWNERKAIQVNAALEEMLESASEVDIRLLSDSTLDYEGKMIHVVGPIAIMEPLTDPDYNIQVLSVKLKKRVQMYQWIEETSGGETFGDTVESNSDTKYWYYKDWRDYPVDSSLFYMTPGHQNPKTVPIPSQTFIADNVKIGPFSLDLELKRKVSDYYDITSDTRPDRADIKLHDGFYFHGESALQHETGDLRVRFAYAGRQDDTYTAVGVVSDGTVRPYTSATAAADPVGILRKGSHTLKQLADIEGRERSLNTWKYRVLGWFQVLAAAMTLHPDWLTLFLTSRWVSSSLAASSRLYIHAVFVTSMTMIVISIPWFFHKPLFATLVLVIGLLPMWHYSSVLKWRGGSDAAHAD